jgi:AcrR family transcriptional regulator
LFNFKQTFNFALHYENWYMDKKQQIIEAAIELFAQKGFEGTSIRDLAAKADVNVAMVNYYFGSKEKLFEALVEVKAASARGTLEELLNDKTLTSIEKIDKIVDSYIDRLFSHRMFHRLIHQELIMNQREALQDSITTLLLPNSLYIKSIINEGIENGQFKQVDVLLTMVSLMGTINQLLLSKKYCLKLLNKGDEYVPYDDPEFRQRVSVHLKGLMRAHLLIGG